MTEIALTLLLLVTSPAAPDLIFADDFESGVLGAWSDVCPWPEPCPWLPSVDPAICDDPGCSCGWAWDHYSDGTQCANLVGFCAGG
jgi:hypothetical protein